MKRKGGVLCTVPLTHGRASALFQSLGSIQLAIPSLISNLLNNTYFVQALVSVLRIYILSRTDRIHMLSWSIHYIVQNSYLDFLLSIFATLYFPFYTFSSYYLLYFLFLLFYTIVWKNEVGFSMVFVNFLMTDSFFLYSGGIKI